MAKFSIPAAPAVYTSSYKDFKGVDLNGDAATVSKSRFPYALNLDFDKRGYPEKRPGVEEVYKFGGDIKSFGEVTGGKIAVHAGNGIFESNSSGGFTKLFCNRFITKSLSRKFSVNGKDSSGSLKNEIEAFKDIKTAKVKVYGLSGVVGIKDIEVILEYSRTDLDNSSLNGVGEESGSLGVSVSSESKISGGAESSGSAESLGIAETSGSVNSLGSAGGVLSYGSHFTGSYYGGAVNSIITDKYKERLFKGAAKDGEITKVYGGESYEAEIPAAFPQNFEVFYIYITVRVTFSARSEESGIKAGIKFFNQEGEELSDYSAENVFSGLSTKEITAEGKSSVISNGFNYYVKGEGFFIKVTEYGVFNVLEDCYSPKIIIGRNRYRLKPSDGEAVNIYDEEGSAFEDINLLSRKVSESFSVKSWKKRTSSDSSAYFYNIVTLSKKAVRIESVKYLSEDGFLVAPPDMYEIYNLGSGNDIAFKSSEETKNGYTLFSSGFEIFGTGGNEVSDNLIITYIAETDENSSLWEDTVKDAYIYELYGAGSDSRLFLTGNSNRKNFVWYSEFNNFSYFPDRGYITVGDESALVMGFSKFGSSLAVFKQKSLNKTGVYFITASVSETGVSFTVSQGVSGTGAVSFGSVTNISDCPAFLSDDGLNVITASSGESSLHNVSYFINSVFKSGDLENADIIRYRDKVLISLSGKVYVLYTGKKTYLENFNAEYAYESMIWDGFNAGKFEVISGLLWFSDGKSLFRFKVRNSKNDMGYFNDTFIGSDGEKYGKAIESYFLTVSDDDGTFMTLKTMVKRGSGIMIKPFIRSSAEIYAITDSGKGKLIKEEKSGILDFSEFYFGTVDFSTNEGARIIPFNSKIKKYAYLQFMIKNCKLNEGFGVYGIEKRFTLGNSKKY